MKVTKQWLEAKIKTLNEWLQSNPTTHFEYAPATQKRNYYVAKLIALEENENLETIKI